MGGGGTHRPSMPRNLWEPWVGHTHGPTCEEPMPSNLEESATEGHYIYHGKPRKTTKGHGRSRQATGGHGRSRDTMGHHVKPLYLTRNHRSMLSLGSILGPPYRPVILRTPMRYVLYSKNNRATNEVVGPEL